MQLPQRLVASTLIAMLGMLAALVPSSEAATSSGLACEKRAARELRACGNTVARQHLKCVKSTGALCAETDAKISASLAKLAGNVLRDCPDGTTIAAAGYGAALTPAGLVDRLQEACVSESMSLAARAFGGPHAAARTAADATGKACLDNAFNQGRTMIDYAYWQRSACLQSAHAGRSCDPAKIAERIAAKQSRVASAVARRCTDLSALVAVSAPIFAQRGADQGECLVPTAHGDTAPLSLACGPRASVTLPARGVSTQIVLDSDVWGTRCGDGSAYAFSIHPAPIGQPLERVVVFTQGGGQCIDGPGCAATPADLFESLSESLPEVGILSSTAATNPFQNWTKVYLPYCTQDSHGGGGIVNAFTEKTVYRYGAVNLRAAMRWVRDALWAQMDASDPEGFRPDRLTVLFSGSSAGGAGVQLNYHYILDDLRWVHSTLLPDSALGLDNGTGATALRAQLVKGATTPGWGGLAIMPPYCFADQCGEGWNTFMFAMVPRLKATPEQQVLSLTNQLDATQRSVGQFANNAAFINTLRTRYCEQRGTVGLHAYLPDSQPQVHGNINDNSRYNFVVTGGILMRDWIYQAMIDPDGVVDRVGEGLTSINGVQPFPCDVGSPSGAFVDGITPGM
ncbi:pectinacetylesterase family protein [Candidatus Binatia bacterium]|nr:pectinacetylesterase family protein [Candidatus Binatia bacterium]